MSNDSPSCPEVTTLKEFLRGQLDDNRIRDVESHLDICSPCGDTVRSMQVDDTLFELARKAASGPTSSAENLIVDDLIARYRDLPEEQGIETRSSDGEDIRQARIDEVESRLSAAQDSEEIGRLAHYRLVRLLGVGGMGVVYLAEDTQLQRNVALKILRPSLGEAARQRFLLEARAAAGIDHDHVITIYQVGEVNQLAYLAMQWLDGETLEDRLQNDNRLTTDEVARIGRELALGLSAAHEQSVVHRDIKPANVWLEANRGRTRILDFGLARAVDENPQLTETGMIAGTPAYMSPEQARGEVVDQRSDLFSLGCVLYRMVTGKLPFSAPNPLATILAIQSEVPQSPRDLNPKLSARLSSIIEWLLAKNPDRRLDSAEKLAELLNEPHGHPVQWDEEVYESTKSHPSATLPKLVTWVGTLTLLLSLTLGTFAAPMIYRIATGQGLLVIESQDANVRVLVLKEGREVKIVDSKNNAIHVKAGQYELQLVDDNANVRLEKQTVVLSSGAKEIVRVVNQPNDTNNAKGDVAKNPTNTFPTGPHKIQPGDILGIFIEGIIGDYRKSPPIHYPSPDSGLPPTMGYPVFVDEKGELSLPLADPIKLSGRTLSEAQSIITNVYVRDKILSSDQSKILVSLLRRRSELTCSPAYQAKPGTVLGVFVEGILGQQGEMPPIHFPDRTTGLPPAVGYPIVVNDTGNVSLPLVDPIPVSGKTISDIRRAITQTYEGTLLKPGRSRILVALIRPHDYKAPYQKTIANSGFNRRDERTRKTMPVDPNWIHVDPEPQNSADWAPRTVPPVKTPSLPSPILGYWKIVGLTNRQEKVDSLHEDSQVVITENKMLFLEKGQLESEGNIEIKATRSFDRIRFSTSDFTSLGILQLTGDYLKIAFNPPGDEEYPANFDAGELRTYMLLRERNKSKIASDDPKATPNSTAWPGQKKNSALDRDSMLEQIDDYETVLKRSVSKLRIQLLAVRNQDHGPRQTEIESAITNITGYAPIHIDSLSIALSSNEDKLAVEVSDRWVPVISKPVQEQLDLTDNNYTTRWNGSDIEVLRENPQTELEQALLAGFPAVATISVDKSVASVDLSIPDEAAQHLNSLTRENIGNYLVVMINKRVVMVPRIRSAVDNDIRLSGKYTLEQLQTMLKPQPQP